MDHKINSASFQLLKNIIIAQNKDFLKHVSSETGLNEEYLIEKYIKPDYYLPIIKKTCISTCQKKEK
jgi:hypothetical protein